MVTAVAGVTHASEKTFRFPSSALKVTVVGTTTGTTAPPAPVVSTSTGTAEHTPATRFSGALAKVSWVGEGRQAPAAQVGSAQPICPSQLKSPASVQCS